MSYRVETAPSASAKWELMSRLALRLVSSICLMTYLFANAHLDLAFQVFSWSECQCTSGNSMTGVESDEPAHPQCKHWEDICLVAAGCRHQFIDPSGESDFTCPPCSDGRSDTSCPCCPNVPAKHSCPCPGGCAMCSVAKAPCLDSVAIFFPASLCVGASLLEEPAIQITPFCDGLVRPPRA